MTAEPPVESTIEPARWYSVPEVAEALGVRDRDVRTMLREGKLLALRRGTNDAVSIPAELILEADHPDGPAPLPSLRGTLTVLKDARYTDREAFEWLYSHHEELGQAPIAALLDHRVHAVRRVAQTLAF